MTAHQDAERRKAVQQPSAHRFDQFCRQHVSFPRRIGPAQDTGAMPADNSEFIIHGDKSQNLPWRNFNFAGEAPHTSSLQRRSLCFDGPPAVVLTAFFIGNTRRQMTYILYSYCVRRILYNPNPSSGRMPFPSNPLNHNAAAPSSPYVIAPLRRLSAPPFNPPSRRCRPC